MPINPIKSLGFSPCGMFFWGKARTRLHNWKKSQKTMIELKRIRRAPCLAAGPLLIACVVWAAQAPTPKILATSSVSLELNAGKQVPALVRIKGPAGLLLVNRQEETLPAAIELDGATVPLAWQHRPALDITTARHVVFVYESDNPHLRLRWEWEARAEFGPVEHRISIENLSGREVWLPMVDSLRLDWSTDANNSLRNLYVEKGAGSPSPQGTHLDTVSDGYHWTGVSSTYAFSENGGPREIIPAEFVFDAATPEAGWYAGIEFSGRTRISLERSGASVKSTLGLNPEPGPFRTRVEPGGSFETPAVFLGAFSGGVDGAGNQLRPWVRAVLNNPLTWKDPNYPLTVNNSWGSGMQVDEALATRMIAESKELGLDLFGLDAGWFRGVGDWYPNPKKFPHGLAAIADEAHRQGLRFGIWLDWTQAALDTEPGALNVRDPKVKDWLVSDLKPDWKPEDFKGETIDIGAPAARDYAAHEVKRIVEDYKLDMLEHDGYLVAQGCIRDDHPHAPPNKSTVQVHHDWGSDIVRDANSTDVSYHAVRAYYGIYEQLRKEHPGLLFEICNDGGRMVDFGTAAHGDYFSITDTYDPLSNRRAFYDTSHVLPAAMLESYVEKWATPHIENFRYMLRSGMMGWLTVMLDTTQWTPEQHDAARSAIALYKQELRPLIRDARLYHVSERPDGVHWDGIEYWDQARAKGVVFAFRGTVADQPEHRFALAGLDPEKRYRLHFQDGTAPDSEASGKDLMAQGLTVRLPQTYSSELVFLTETTAGK
jgi:disulfide oxidoreductase YuzD